MTNRLLQAILFALLTISGLKAQSLNPLGEPDDQWKTVSIRNHQIAILTNKALWSGDEFRTYIEMELPEDYIVDEMKPQSMLTQIIGSCNSNIYQVYGTVGFTGHHRTGFPLVPTDPEPFKRKLAPGSLMEKAFNTLCTLRKNQQK
jgi:hypothetical protein